MTSNREIRMTAALLALALGVASAHAAVSPKPMTTAATAPAGNGGIAIVAPRRAGDPGVILFGEAFAPGALPFGGPR